MKSSTKQGEVSDLRSALQCAKETSFIQSVMLKMTTTKLGTGSALVMWMMLQGRTRTALVLIIFRVASRVSVLMDIILPRRLASPGRISFFFFAMLACAKKIRLAEVSSQ